MVVEIKNLVKRYKENLAVDNINLTIKQGEIFGLLGPNGAGKSTTINMIIGLTKLDSGEIKIFNKSMSTQEMEIKKEIGIVPQDIAVFSDMSAYENVDFFGRLYGLKGNILKERVKEALDFTGLYDRSKEYPKNYSGGMKRRLNIACAIVHRPKLIVMDEPTVGVDPQSRNHILESVRKLNEMGSTIIYTSHYMEEIEEICTYVSIMDHGRVIAQGTKDELKAMIASEDKIALELSLINNSLIEEIKSINGVLDCVEDFGKLNIVSKKNSSNLSNIIDKINSSGSELLSMNIEKPTLEGVFLTLTGRTLRN